MPKRKPDAAGWQCDFFERARSPATAAKHLELGLHFNAWLARHVPEKQVRTVFDGFAGAGRFVAGEALPTPGSPLLLLKWAQARPEAGPLRFVFSEPNPLNLSRLRAAVAGFLGQPEGATLRLGAQSIALHGATVEHTAAALLGQERVGPGELFSFVDPYAYEGLDFATLAALAARGDLVLHLASHALATKLMGTNGDGLRQGRRMGRLLGGALTWDALRAAAIGMTAPQVQALIAERVVAALAAERPEVQVRLHPLRDGKSHLVTAQHGGA